LLLAVIETSPTKIPLTTAIKSILTFLFKPEIYYLVRNVKNPEVEADKIVLSMASEALSTLFVSPDVDPPLNKSQLNHKIIVPRMDSIGL
jgi:hypothetical protein